MLDTKSILLMLRGDAAHGRLVRVPLRRKPEVLESRTLLSVTPIQFGAVYVEQDLGSDAHADTIEISFVGGVVGSELTRIELDGDQFTPGLSLSDMIFDTHSTGLGADLFFDGIVTSRSGEFSDSISVEDGSSKLILELSGFHAGDKLTLSIDVDEVQGFDLDESDLELINEELDPIASGAEFQGSQLIAYFSAPNHFDAEGVAEFRNRYDRLLEPTELELPLDDDNNNRDRTAGAVGELTQSPLPISISGRVFEDRNGDLIQAAEDPGLADVQLDLFIEQDGQYVFTGHTVHTSDQAGALGEYVFSTDLGLLPGNYQIRETQPAGFFSVGAQVGQVDGVTTGVIETSDILGSISIPHGGIDAIEYNFAESRPVSLRGSVHTSTPDGDCWDDSIQHEPVIGATILLLDANGNTVGETITNSSGNYEFTDLRPGEYSLVEITPDELLEGGAQAGQVDGQSRGIAGTSQISGIELFSGENGVEYEFCDHIPASLSGSVYHDRDNDGLKDVGEEGIDGAILSLLDEDGFVVDETRSDSSGRYEFVGVRAGNYRVIELQPNGWLDGKDQAGTIGGERVGRAVNPGDEIAAISLLWGDQAIDYDFGELQPASIAGRVHLSDVDGDCWGIEEELLEPVAGAVVQLIDATGQVLSEAITAADGTYSFDDLMPGEYSIRQLTPAGLQDGGAQAGTVDGRPAGSVLDSGNIQAIVLGSAAAGVNYDFCEHQPSTLSGFVYTDNDNDGIREAGEAPIEGVIIQLFDELGNLVAETQTGADGQYTFEQLPPGNYSLRQIQPDGFFDGLDTAGTVDGEPRGRAINPGDQLIDIKIGWGQTGVEYNFAELLPGSISGSVHSSGEEDCWNDEDAVALSGVTIILLGEDGRTIAQTSTNESGEYSFNGLAPGLYTVVQVQPDTHFDGAQRAGTSGGDASTPNRIESIDLGSGIAATKYDFCEKPPSSISGTVHSSPEEDCWDDIDAAPLAGVTMELRDELGDIVAETTTDALGRYVFENLPEGVYSVTQLQPDSDFDGGQRAGTSGGDASLFNQVVDIDLLAGVDSVNYDFCEIPPSAISGFVFVDGEPISLGVDDELTPYLSEIRDGQLTPDDTRLPGIRLELRDGLNGNVIDASTALVGYYPDGPIQAVTDEQGYYEFAGLPRGNYAVYQFHPAEYIDGIDTGGTTPAIPINPVPPGDEFEILIETVTKSLSEPPRNDAIVRIQLPRGAQSQLNNFSEVLTVRLEPPTQPPPFFPPAIALPPLSPRVDTQPVELLQSLGELAPTPLVDNPIIADGSSSMMNTWHLSIIDGGQPRVAERGQDSGYLFPASLWQQHQLAAGKWTLKTPDGETATRYFGVSDGIPITGDFNGDGSTEIGMYAEGHWFIDLNGNGRWDSKDLWARLGRSDDIPVTGDWDGDGKDDIGIFGRAWPGDFRAAMTEPGLPDMDNAPDGKQKNLPPDEEDATVGRRVMKLTAKGSLRSDVIDHVFLYGRRGDIGVVGDWNGDGIDTVGIFRDGTWRLDVDGNGRWTDPDEKSTFGSAGDLPLVGDFNGDGIDDVAIIRNGEIVIDANRNRRLDADDIVVEYDASQGLPVAGKWTGGAGDTIGFYKRVDAEKLIVAERPDSSTTKN